MKELLLSLVLDPFGLISATAQKMVNFRFAMQSDLIGLDAVQISAIKIKEIYVVPVTETGKKGISNQ